ncbi:MAG: class I SAM-dependent methyltransferase [Candidatus Bathyarchaeota archaeon]|nr:class I SAM-dependent methyltransferase [Candidatus Bathyarchaeota archaeon]
MNYGPASKYYDLFASKDDVDFYKELAVKQGRKALELGVGTGRVAIELAKADVTVWGIDNSRYMLNVARQKLKMSSASIRQRVRLKLGDIRNFKLKEKFPLIYIPSATFEHCITQEDQNRCLTKVYNALEIKGILAFDVSQLSSKKRESSGWIDRRELSSKEEVVRTIFSRRNPQTNIVSVNLFFEVYQEGKLKERYYEYGEARIFSRKEIEKTLKDIGFRVDRVYGNFDRSPHSPESQRLIFVASVP